MYKVTDKNTIPFIQLHKISLNIHVLYTIDLKQKQYGCVLFGLQWFKWAFRLYIPGSNTFIAQFCLNPAPSSKTL